MSRPPRTTTLQILFIATLAAIGLLVLLEARKASGVQSAIATPRGAPDKAVTAPAVLPVKAPTLLGEPPAGQLGSVLIGGTLSYVDARYGPSYLALPYPRGTVATICGPGGCVTRRSTDYGPDQRVHPNRIADLSAADFVYVCGVPLSAGLCKGTVELEPPVDPDDDEMREEDGGPAVTTPPTDVQ